MSTPRHTRRSFLTSATAAGAAALAPHLLPAARSPEQRRPNLVFFLGEGARWDESSLAGNALLKTPHIDRIGREGAVFDNAFCINSLCLPARATILSGLYSHVTGAVDNQHSRVPARFPILSDLIRAAGYEVAFIGKSHVEGSLLDHYWDYYFGFAGQADYQCPVVVEGVRGRFGPPRQYHDYVDDLLTRKAVAWLKQPHQSPLCLFLWFYAPHAPFDRPLRMVNDFNGVPIPKPASFDEYLSGYAGKPRGVIEARNKIGAQFLERDAPRSLEELVKDHYCGIESNDENIAQVLDVLERAGTLDDTAVLWSSDHGFFLGEHRFYDKRLMYEPSIRIPLIVRYPPRIAAGTSSQRMALNLDLAPTLLDLAGAPVPAHFQGHSLLPLLADPAAAWRSDWLYEYYEYPGNEQVRPCRGVRTERYKYIHYFTSPEEFELYDLGNDPDELHNLYGDPAHAGLTRQLAARLEELRRETGDHYAWQRTSLLKQQAASAGCEDSE
ncbi:MAG TPA: sulfatase [Steroidobacteraceae bacterium]|jgi:arylsulfatase A-like enzyme|nr:sulfatase [Steroidobacteraceae bacterium]